MCYVAMILRRLAVIIKLNVKNEWLIQEINLHIILSVYLIFLLVVVMSSLHFLLQYFEQA